MNDMSVVEPIVAGQLWAMPKDGPWDETYKPVTILGVRDGWVRYSMSEFFPDNRMQERNFRQCYRRAEPQVERDADEAMHERFERWAHAHGWISSRNGDGLYQREDVQYAFCAFRAGALGLGQ